VKILLRDYPAGKKQTLERSVSGDPVWLAGIAGTFAGPIRVELTLENTPEAVLLEGILRFELVAGCSLCLEEFTASYSCPFAEPVWKEKGGHAEESIMEFSEEELDLTPLLAATVILNLPLAPVCREDCAGLCPDCGKNLNLGTCACVPDTLDPRMMKLQQLLES
jgi:uncharacterized protein